MKKPVAWIHYFKGGGYQITPNKKYPKDQPLYLSPPKKWQRLTDEEINELCGPAGFGQGSVRFNLIVQAIETKLREKNGD